MFLSSDWQKQAFTFQIEDELSVMREQLLAERQEQVEALKEQMQLESNEKEEMLQRKHTEGHYRVILCITRVHMLHLIHVLASFGRH